MNEAAREFITLLGGAAAAWPLAARAQQAERMRRIGVLMNLAADDPEAQARIAAFRQALQQLGWTDGRNVRIDYRWGGAMPDRYSTNMRRNWLRSRRTSSWPLATPACRPLQQATRTVPIVFVNVADPVGAGFVESLARPGGNATGFISFEYGIEREMAGTAQGDRARRDARGGASRCRHSRWDRPIRRDPGRGTVVRGGGERRLTCAMPARSSAPSRHSRASPKGGLIVTASTLATRHRDLIIILAAGTDCPRSILPATSSTVGGLVSYGPDSIDQFRRAAGYVDRILKGEKPADLPVQAPTKYELVHQPQDCQGARPHCAADAASRRERHWVHPV